MIVKAAHIAVVSAHPPIKMVINRSGLEPAIFRVLGRRDNHFTTKNLSNICG